jgi:hypothetical protein
MTTENKRPLMYLTIATVHCTYYGTWRLQTDKHYEKMGDLKVASEKDHGGGEKTVVTFGQIEQIQGSTSFDMTRLVNSAAYRDHLGGIAAAKAGEKAEEEAEEKRMEEAARKARTIYTLSYSDSAYPEENRIIASFRNEKDAEDRRDLECSSARSNLGAKNHHANELNYSITEQGII